MAIREIVTLENPVLRKKAHRVTVFDDKLQKLARDMVETMIEAPGVGLAAPQIGIAQRLIVVRLTDDEESREEYGDQAGVTYIVCNPEIIRTGKTLVEGVEACLSIPGYMGKVDRYEQIVLKGQDEKGKPIRIKANDWLARVFQHEIDHLDGKLYIDIASSVWKDEPRKEDDADSETPSAESATASGDAPTAASA